MNQPRAEAQPRSSHTVFPRSSALACFGCFATPLAQSPERLLPPPIKALPAPGVGAGWGCYLHLWHNWSAPITRAESLAVSAVVSSETTHPQPGQRHSRDMTPNLRTTVAPCSRPSSPGLYSQPWDRWQSAAMSTGQPMASSALGRKMFTLQLCRGITASNEG